MELLDAVLFFRSLYAIKFSLAIALSIGFLRYEALRLSLKAWQLH